MTTTTPDRLDTLLAEVRGPVVRPGDDAYDTARAVYNGMHDRRPAVVVRCVDAADVIACVRAATETGLPLAVRGGGHSVPGFGTVDDGIVCDLSPMRWVRVDPTHRTALVGGGATWGDVDHATGAFGLATTGGIISTTGVAGLTLGGGIGHLARGCGLSCDNLRAAEVVTADGRLVTATDHDHEDLMWALRGGGGNFGIVTSLTFDLHPVGTVLGGPVFFELDAAAEVMAGYRELIGAAPEELGAFFAFQIAPPLPFIPPERHGEPLCLIVTCWTGDPDPGARMLEAVRSLGPVVADHLGPIPYPALNSAFDALLPPGLRHYWKADFVAELTDAAIAAHCEHGARVPTVQSTMHLYPIDGAPARVPPDATAFAHRGARFAMVIAGMWTRAADDADHTAWVRDYYAAVHPHNGSDAGYVNFMAADDAHRVAANYGPNYERLREIKARWDPTNLFRHNQNIPPS